MNCKKFNFRYLTVLFLIFCFSCSSLSNINNFQCERHIPRDFIPILVFLEPFNQEWEKNVIEACNQWGSDKVVYGGMSLELTSIIPPNTSGIVPIIIENYGNESYTFNGIDNKDGCTIKWSYITIPYNWDIKFRTKTIAHELGHVFGYVHTNDPNSVMYPFAITDRYNFNNLRK